MSDDAVDDWRDSLTSEPPHFEPAGQSVLTPMGQVDSIGSFARGLGARRVKIGIGVAGAIALLLAFMTAMS